MNQHSNRTGIRWFFGVLSMALIVQGLTSWCDVRAAAMYQPEARQSMSFSLKSSAFQPGADIPAKYTCSGEDMSPELSWSNPPAGTSSFALIVDDPDAPSGTFTHWVLYNLNSQAASLHENTPKSEKLPDGTMQGRNDFRRVGYGGPCPPPGKPHRYFFRLYALDGPISLQPAATRGELEKAMHGHVLGEAELMGTFRR